MPTGPAARTTDMSAHPVPGALAPGPGCPTVLIGYLPAWRGINPAAAAGLQAAKISSESTLTAASGTPGYPAALAAAATAMSSAIMAAAGGADIHACTTPTPAPHGPGVVINPSATVIIGGLGAARMGDTIIEAIGPPNSIVKGEPTVIIGG